MQPNQIKEQIEHTGIDLCDMLDLLAMRNPTHNIVHLREIVGDSVFSEILCRYNGTYTRMPTGKRTQGAIDDVRLVKLWWEYEASLGKDSNAIMEKQDLFMKHAKRMGISAFSVAVRRARAVAREMDKAAMWNHQHSAKSAETKR